MLTNWRTDKLHSVAKAQICDASREDEMLILHVSVDILSFNEHITMGDIRSDWINHNSRAAPHVMRMMFQQFFISSKIGRRFELNLQVMVMQKPRLQSLVQNLPDNAIWYDENLGQVTKAEALDLLALAEMDKFSFRKELIYRREHCVYPSVHFDAACFGDQ
jgi:hypothetical protein